MQRIFTARQGWFHVNKIQKTTKIYKIIELFFPPTKTIHKTTYDFYCIGWKVLEGGGKTDAQDLGEEKLI